MHTCIQMKLVYTTVHVDFDTLKTKIVKEDVGHSEPDV